MALVEHNRLDLTELSDTAVCGLFAAVRFMSDDTARKNVYRALLLEIERRDITQEQLRSAAASGSALPTIVRVGPHRPLSRDRTRTPST